MVVYLKIKNSVLVKFYKMSYFQDPRFGKKCNTYITVTKRSVLIEFYMQTITNLFLYTYNLRCNFLDSTLHIRKYTDLVQPGT